MSLPLTRRRWLFGHNIAIGTTAEAEGDPLVSDPLVRFRSGKSDTGEYYENYHSHV
jgi:hypothetical protein